MKVITVINDQYHRGFNLLRLSCSANNLDLLVLVYGQKNFFSNRIKDNLLLNYLDRHTKDDEIIFFSDGNDAILLCPESEILSKYYGFGKEVVFSAERVCWPDTTLAKQFPVSTSAYRYLNCGGFVGTAGVIKQLLREELPSTGKFEHSNQYLWARRFLKHVDLIALDTACEIFHTFSPEVGKRFQPIDLPHNVAPFYSCMKKWFTENFAIDKGRLFSKITGTWPCHAHFNGDAKVIMDIDIINMVFSQIGDGRKARFIEGVTNAPIA